ncbi:uncharacterized protein LOC117806523 [Xyrichtys novacula]|uniref:Uncharacterized protein LOC117806523 n=1 Tax=Xyrichtys novacula TaxID=13765 RepID=A0AAV1GQ65_XYRNO|nr:uncharacterized protein LOC117806523 [Xyrichtys novacula]
MNHNMIVLLLINHVIIYLASGSSLSEKITQTPDNIHRKQGETAKFNCSHEIDNYNNILWYKQSDGQLKFLRYMYRKSPDEEKDPNVKIEGSAAKGKTCTLTILKVDLNSSAVYFCAASLHSLTYRCSSIQKPSSAHINSSL